MIDINKEIKAAMLSKDSIRLASLRAIKTAFMMAETEKGASDLTVEGQLKIIQKQVKQRKILQLFIKNKVVQIWLSMRCRRCLYWNVSCLSK